MERKIWKVNFHKANKRSSSARAIAFLWSFFSPLDSRFRWWCSFNLLLSVEISQYLCQCSSCVFAYAKYRHLVGTKLDAKVICTGAKRERNVEIDYGECYHSIDRAFNSTSRAQHNQPSHWKFKKFCAIKSNAHFIATILNNDDSLDTNNRKWWTWRSANLYDWSTQFSCGKNDSWQGYAHILRAFSRIDAQFIVTFSIPTFWTNPDMRPRKVSSYCRYELKQRIRNKSPNAIITWILWLKCIYSVHSSLFMWMFRRLEQLAQLELVGSH